MAQFGAAFLEPGRACTGCFADRHEHLLHKLMQHWEALQLGMVNEGSMVLSMLRRDQSQGGEKQHAPTVAAFVIHISVV